MTDWPPILDANLAGRLAMSEDEFAALAHRLGARLGGREFVDADFERAIAYPWERPEVSFYMEDGAVTLLRTPEDFARLPERDPGGAEQRYSLITFGSNGSPGVLASKLSVLDPDARDVLVLAGELSGFDVVASAHVAVYGAMPATIVASPGTSVRAAVISVTAAQFTALTRTEFNYAVVRIGGAAFAPDLPDRAPDPVFAYVSRNGAFSVEGESVALKAVPAAGRRFNELEQEHVLDAAAELILGPGASAIDVVRNTIADYAWSIDVARPALAGVTNPYAPEDWQTYPAW